MEGLDIAMGKATLKEACEKHGKDKCIHKASSGANGRCKNGESKKQDYISGPAPSMNTTRGKKTDEYKATDTDDCTMHKTDAAKIEKYSHIEAAVPSCVNRDQRRQPRLQEMSSATCSSSSTASSTSTDGYREAEPRLLQSYRLGEGRGVACSDSEQVQKLTHSRRYANILMKTQSHSIDVALLGADRASSVNHRHGRGQTKLDNAQARLRKTSDHGLTEKTLHGGEVEGSRYHHIHGIKSNHEKANQKRNTKRVKFSSSEMTLISRESQDDPGVADEVVMRPRSQSLVECDDASAPRLVFVGDQYVGKTELIARFTQDLFNKGLPSHQTASKVIKYTKSVFHKRLGRQVRVQFWDIDGGETSTAITCAQSAHAVVAVYDVTNRSSFDKAQSLLESINPRVSAVLVGNKLDIQDLRRVSYEEGRILARIHRVQYVETSVKYNHNVEETLQLLLACVPKEYLVKGASLVAKRRSMSDSKPPSGGESEVCGVCQNKLSSRQHRKDEIDI